MRMVATPSTSRAVAAGRRRTLPVWFPARQVHPNGSATPPNVKPSRAAPRPCNPPYRLTRDTKWGRRVMILARTSATILPQAILQALDERQVKPIRAAPRPYSPHQHAFIANYCKQIMKNKLAVKVPYQPWAAVDAAREGVTWRARPELVG